MEISVPKFCKELWGIIDGTTKKPSYPLIMPPTLPNETQKMLGSLAGY